MKKLYYLFIFIPISIVLHFIGTTAVIQFTVTSIAIIPLAGIMGEATEELSAYIGSKLGGFLNATLGNSTELIISFFALKAGLFDIVRFSIAGAMIGNILLVLGASMLMGGLKFKTQKFSIKGTNVSLNMLTFAIISVIVPAIFAGNLVTSRLGVDHSLAISVGICIIMLILYVCSLYFSFFTHKDIFGVEHEVINAKWSKNKSISILVGATVLVAAMSELLVGSIEPMTQQLHLSKYFVGLIILPIIGNAAEHSTAVLMAMKNKMDVAIEIAIGSSLQIILFVAPVLVLISFFFKPMSLIFGVYEIVSLIVAVLIANKVCSDGESNWLEGLQLISVYLILAVTYFLI